MRCGKGDAIDSSGLSEQEESLTAQTILQQIFPALSSGHSATALSQRMSYVIAQGGEPRWIIPANTRLALPVLRSWEPNRLKTRLQWGAILLGCRSGMLSRLPGVGCETAHVDSSYWRRWLAGFSDEWEVVVYAGTPSYTRKAIVFFVDKDAAVKAVAKVPLRASAKGAILNEAALSRRLRSKHLLPEMLFADEERGIAAQTWVQGEHVSRTLRKEHIDLLSQLVCEGESTRLCDYRDPIASQIDSLDLPMEASLLRRALYLLESTCELPVFIEHGDFAPWNLRRLPDRSLALIDWEWGIEKGLPWQDICHYFYIQDHSFGGTRKVWDTLIGNPLLLTYIRRFGIPLEILPGLTMHYLLRELCLRYRNAEQPRVNFTVKQILALMEAHHL